MTTKRILETSLTPTNIGEVSAEYSQSSYSEKITRPDKIVDSNLLLSVGQYTNEKMSYVVVNAKRAVREELQNINRTLKKISGT